MSNQKKPVSDIVAHIGAKIVELRKAKGLTQDDLANELGLSRTSILNIERGRHRTTTETLYAVCMLLGVTPNDLFPPVVEVYQFEVEEKTIMVPRVVKTKVLKKIPKQ